MIEIKEIERKKTPLYKLKSNIKDTEFKLEILKEEPSKNASKISMLRSRLKAWKREYKERVARLKMKREKKAAGDEA